MIYIIILLTITFGGLLFAFRDPRRNFLFLFTLTIYFVYIILGPLNAIIQNDYEKLGGFFYHYFDEGLAIYSLALSVFVCVYILTFLVKVRRPTNASVISYHIINKSKTNFYTICFFIIVTVVVVMNTGFTGEHSIDSSYNYFLFFADSLILCFVILFYEKKYSVLLLVLTAVSLIYFLILGFRYRIILLLIAYIYHLLLSNRLTIKSLFKGLSILIISGFIINFISVNRSIFSNQEFDQIEFTADSPYELSPYQFVMQQTENYSTDFNVLKFFNETNISHDYGFSMFGHIFIRITPASFYSDGRKPQIPQQEIIKNCFTTLAGEDSGSAVTNIFQYYIAFGVYGVIFFMGLLAYIMATLSKKLDLSIPRNRVIIIFMSMVVFQEVTRGYLPQNATLFVYLYIPFKLFYRKIK